MGEDLDTRFTEWHDDTIRIARERAAAAAKVNPWSVFVMVAVSLSLLAGVTSLSVYLSDKKQEKNIQKTQQEFIQKQDSIIKYQNTIQR